MYRRLLVPYDGSPISRRGLDEAIRLARATGARLRLVHLIDVFAHATGFETAAAYARLIPIVREGAEGLLRQGRSLAEQAGVPVETFLCDNLATRLCDVVNDQVAAWDADLIVVGTRGRRGVDRWLLGSDAEQIARHAPVPVLFVGDGGGPPARRPGSTASVPEAAEAGALAGPDAGMAERAPQARRSARPGIAAVAAEPGHPGAPGPAGSRPPPRPPSACFGSCREVTP